MQTANPENMMLNVIDIVVPSPGESVSEAQIASWLIENGAFVEKDNEIAEIDSEKATLSIVAPVSGTIEILAEVGKVVKIGATVARITAAEGENVPDKNAVAEPELVAENTTASPNRNIQKEDEQLKLTPLARNVLKGGGFTEAEFISYLKKHRFGVADVKDFIENHNKPEPSKQKTAPARIKTEGEMLEPMSMLRRKLAARLVAVKNETAMLTTFNEIDMSAIMAFRSEHKDAFLSKHGVKLSMMSFFTLAASKALSEFPQVAAQIHGDDIVKFNFNDIGIAVSTPKGLMVPVIRGVQTLSLVTVEKAIAAMAEKARSGKIALADLQGGTFTITNGGVFGSLLSTPILNPPQSAILGMHNIVERPVVKNGAIVAAPMMYVALSYDHRVIDGRESVAFLLKIKEFIENPLLLDSENGSITNLLEI